VNSSFFGVLCALHLHRRYLSASAVPLGVVLRMLSGMMLLAWCSFCNPANRSAYRRCLWSRTTATGVNLASAISGAIGVVFIHPVIANAYQLIIFCTASALGCWPLQQTSEPNSADA
jgi:hypothetical protein